MKEEPWAPLRARADLDWGLLEAYALELERWNRAVRLVGPRSLEGIRVQIADALLPFLLVPPQFPLLDVGSGAGLPGIPIAIAHGGARSGGVPDVACLEPQAKRQSFLRHVVRTLGLRSVRVVGARAEEAAGDATLTGSFLAVTARAVGDVRVLLGLAEPFLAPSGRVFLPRGAGGAASVAGWLLLVDLPYEGPPGVGARRLAVYEREGRAAEA